MRAISYVGALLVLVIAMSSIPMPCYGGTNGTFCVTHVESLDYPRVARAAHVDGTVVIRLLVGADGHVKAATKVSGPDVLAQAAKANALKWVFKTDRQRNLDVRYEFRLGPAATSEAVTAKVSFDFPSHVLISVPARPIIVN